MLHPGCIFVAGFHPSRTWMSGSLESVRWNACVHRLRLGLYSHPKEFSGNGVRTHVNSKGKIPSTGKNRFRGAPWSAFRLDNCELVVHHEHAPWRLMRQREHYLFMLVVAHCLTWATIGVMVSTSAFLISAFHQYKGAGSSLSWGLNFGALVCGIIWSASLVVFSEYSGFLPSFIG